MYISILVAHDTTNACIGSPMIVYVTICYIGFQLGLFKHTITTIDIPTTTTLLTEHNCLKTRLEEEQYMNNHVSIAVFIIFDYFYSVLVFLYVISVVLHHL